MAQMEPPWIRQKQAMDPAQKERPPGAPELLDCQLLKVMVANKPGGQAIEAEIVVATESGLTFKFERSLKDAIYGQVWDALEVKYHRVSDSEGGVDYFTVVLDEQGCPRRLAVKRMRWDTINKTLGTIRENPLHEIAFLTKMQDPGHPNVVGLTEALDDGSTVYLITPFVGGDEGGEMFDWVADSYGSPAPEAVVRPLFRQIVDGILYVHSKGVCHADMSLENTLINGERDKAFIIDFGMALQMPVDENGRRCKSVPDNRRAKTSYCPPETFKGKEYDGVKVDVFSVGCMGFMMLTGIPPFNQATRADPAFRKVVYRGDLQGYLASYGMPLLPEPVFRLLKAMMAYNPEDRPLPVEVLADPWFGITPQGAAPTETEAVALPSSV